MKKLLTLALLFLGLKMMSQHQTGTLAGSLGSRIGRGGYMTTITTGIEKKYVVKVFCNPTNKFEKNKLDKKTRIFYYGTEIGYNFIRNDYPINVIISTQIGMYNSNIGIGFPQLETRWHINKYFNPSLIFSPDHIEVRLTVFKIFE